MHRKCNLYVVVEKVDTLKTLKINSHCIGGKLFRGYLKACMRGANPRPHIFRIKEELKMKNKGICLIALIITIIVIIGLCGVLIACNYQIVDFDYTFDYAIINLGGEYKKIPISSWTDYEGEQLQIKDKHGNIYLTNSYNCTLIKGEI